MRVTPSRDLPAVAGRKGAAGGIPPPPPSLSPRRGAKKFKALEAKEKAHQIEKVGKELRKLMPFIDAKEV